MKKRELIIYMLPIPKCFKTPWKLFRDNVSTFWFSQQYVLWILFLGFDSARAWNLPAPPGQCDKVPPPLFLNSHIPSLPVDKTWTHPHPNYLNHKDAGSRFTWKQVSHPRLQSAKPHHHNQWQYSSKALHTSNENQKLSCQLHSKNI